MYLGMLRKEKIMDLLLQFALYFSISVSVPHPVNVRDKMQKKSRVQTMDFTLLNIAFWD